MASKPPVLRITVPLLFQDPNAALAVSTAGEQATPTVTASTPNLSYSGGPLLQSVQVQVIFWGTYWAGQSSVMAQIDQFFTFVLQSSLIDLLEEYGIVGHGTYRGSIVEHSPPFSVSVTDADIQLALNGSAGWIKMNPSVQKPTANTLYFVYLPPSVVVKSPQGDTSCQQMCGYHWYIAGTSPEIYYAVMPFPSCDGCQGSHTQIEALTLISSHELCEAITDPRYPSGWLDSSNGEIGDICAQKPSQVIGGFTVQKMWSNNQSKCAVGPKPLPPGKIQAIRSAGEDSFVLCEVNDGPTLLKVLGVGGTGQNMFAVRRGNGGAILGTSLPLLARNTATPSPSSRVGIRIRRFPSDLGGVGGRPNAEGDRDWWKRTEHAGG
jgi:hypothetical protein